MDTSSIITINVIGVGIESMDNGKEILIYPNPATSTLHVKADVPVDLHLYNTTGKLVLEQKNAREADVRHLPEGIYVIRLFDQSGQLIKEDKLSISGRN